MGQTIPDAERERDVRQGVALLITHPGAVARHLLALALLIAMLALAHQLHISPEYGARAGFSLLIGVAVGIVFERGRFCYFCIMRDYIEHKDSNGMFAILASLVVGSVGYVVLFGAFLPDPTGTRLPPDAHIGPVSWVLALAGVLFGLGMALSGACISGHLYRLGEGYSRAPLALLGALFGFALGFLTWQTLYVNVLSLAPVAWLPRTLGYGGALLLQLLLLGVLGVIFLRRLPEHPPTPGGRLTLRDIYDAIFVGRWHPLITGGLVGLLGIALYFRVEPLGVTAQLGSISRTLLADTGILEGRLIGLDTFAGCATMVVQAIMNNGWLIGGLVIGSLSVALIANRFQPSRLTVGNSTTALIGGVLMGWGAMTALGCTVGTLLSGISALAVSGWVFGVAVFVGVWLGIRLKWVE